MAEYYRTTIQIEIISIGPYSPTNLSQVVQDIEAGPYGSSWGIRQSTPVPERAALEICRAASIRDIHPLLIDI